MKNLTLALSILVLGGCAQVPLSGIGQIGQSGNEAQARLQHGLAQYKESRYDTALADLNAAVASGQLKSADNVNARKHIAFIHCASNREALCREQFQAILKADPDFDLPANEASHPTWGPVWRSTKVVLDDQRTVSRGSGILAGPGLKMLAEGIKEYDAGRYKEAIVALQAAIKNGLKEKSDQVRAHKYTAFSYCLTQNRSQCSSAFRTLFAFEPAFELVSSEAGHPAWSGIYRKELAAARKASKKQQQHAGKAKP